jgi:hypothetical protein
VSVLHLPAVDDDLVEDAELVADAVADGRDLQRGQRVHVAGGQPAEAAVAETRLLLVLEQLVEIEVEARSAGLLAIPHEVMPRLIMLLARCHRSRPRMAWASRNSSCRDGPG